MSSIYASLSSNFNLSKPILLQQWILSHLNPFFPKGFLYEKTNIPLDKSAPIWFKCGGIGYILPLKSKFYGKYIFYTFYNANADSYFNKKSHFKELLFNKLKYYYLCSNAVSLSNL